MEILKMSAKERRRLELMGRIKRTEITLAKGAELMGISYRQSKRIWKRFQKSGDKSLIHGLRGKAGGRSRPEAFKQKVMVRYQERYGDFGPTLACEHLALEGMSVDHETLRRWLLAKGIWLRKRERKKHRQWRERKEHLGELVQLDGSHHDWFEGRGEWAVLMVMVDDATNQTHAKFFEEETTEAAYWVFKGYVEKHGLPQGLYVDRDSIYKVSREAGIEEQMHGERPVTQFARAMKLLAVDLKLAYSPQAKGRVERMNGLLQDRLVKEMRLVGISNIEAGNAFLEKDFLKELNRKGMFVAAQETDLHRKVPAGIKLDEVLSWEEERHVGQDWTVQWEKKWLQLTKENTGLNLAGKKVTVRQLLDGKLQLLYRGKKLKWKELPGRPQRAREKKGAGVGVKNEVKKEPARSPWRSFGIAAGKSHWKKVRSEGQAVLNEAP